MLTITEDDIHVDDTCKNNHDSKNDIEDRPRWKTGFDDDDIEVIDGDVEKVFVSNNKDSVPSLM